MKRHDDAGGVESPLRVSYTRSVAGRLEGKTALITGASRGIGRAIASLFAREGAAVVINYLSSSAAAQQLAEQIRQEGGRALAIQADVSRRPEAERLVQEVLAQLEQIDILVNNAAVLVRGGFLDFREEELDRMIAVNLKGVIHCSRAVAPGMMQRRYGKIINLASLAALGTNVEGTSPYAATKGAVVTLTKRMALELGPSGINVNGICPGFIQTDMLELGRSPEEVERALQGIRARSMLGLAGTPEDVAYCALFLASDEARFITGQLITVDGGRTDFLTYSA